MRIEVILLSRKRAYLLAALCVTVFIFSNSVKNADTSGAQSSLLLGIINSIPLFAGVTHNLLRKTAHIAEFFAQGTFLAAFFAQSDKKIFDRLVCTAFFGLLTACTDEFIQLFSAGRSSEVKDVFIDFSGTIAALIIFAAAAGIDKRRRRKNA